MGAWSSSVVPWLLRGAWTAATRSPGGFWRLYELNSDMVRCSIREEFRADTFELHMQPTMRVSGKSWLQSQQGNIDW